ncbi:RsmD family RNA methyltransferase [Flammeovirga yaeyamensis]|uniref:RsmD family RNA methyltransferase n=1 Tax=Flammeovirga yaeyamensis TaxID=367791 RepID=A0AAX1N947_9BACT|nr:class I SAM-dependent methyltransferase [Flammeovirga yaeyamensis]MBB3697320.1 16S rRNA G966 N2-methylase RsmD [Flammeovirga yaeyamensis]NMF36014.1 SAM-dependent methyltransferase [Flammeovirga yaeyamensis]QWG02750.1 RsmD family RNA methyltransferase [Flammeovirga yaeyamensis]
MIIDTITKQFIQDHLDENPADIAFKAQKFPEVDGKVAAHQIASRQKAKKKLPTWFENAEVIFPEKVPLEQSSSEKAAKYKASLVEGESMIDLTGGMGVDDWAFSFVFKKVMYAERQKDLSEISAQNFASLGRNNVEVIQGDSLEWLHQCNQQFDVIYVDPARRDEHNKKVVMISDCEPNLIEHQDLLKEKSKSVLIKLSPMLDIKQSLRQLDNVSKVWVIAVDGECKEILFYIDHQQEKINTEITCVDLKQNGGDNSFSFILENEEYTEVELASELYEYLYEPNAAVMKGGAFKTIANQFGLKKIHLNTHLYTSEELIDDFPGRKFKIVDTLQVQKKVLQKHLPSLKANLSVRNFPQTVDQLKKKLKLKDGGNDFLFATTLFNNDKVLLKCEKTS